MTIVMATMTPPGSGPRRGNVSERLVERDRELAVLGEFLSHAGASAGGVVLMEAPPGGGKSRMLAAARELAHESQMRILTAAGAELEGKLPLGLAMRLFEAQSRAVDQHDELLRGPLSLAATLMDDTERAGPTKAEERYHSAIRALVRAMRHLAGLPSPDGQAEGLAILVDDLQWADRPSLRFLAYVAERAADLRVAVVLTATPLARSADPQALSVLRRAAAGRVLPLAPLSARGTERVVRGRFPHADAEFCASCARATSGNPFLLTELLAAFAQDGQPATAALASSIEETVPDVVRDMTRARLESVSCAPRKLAKALAVLGEAASVSRIARLAELDSERVLIAADELAAAHVLAPSIPLSFAQPMLASAIRNALPPFERAEAHRRAARMLAEEQADAELIAAHLLHTPAEDDPVAAAVLGEAAQAALQRSEPELATRLLARAMAERDGHSERPPDMALAQGQALYARGDFRGAAAVLDAGLAEVDGEHELARELNAAYVAAAALVGELQTDALAARDQLLADQTDGLRPLARTAFAHTVALDAVQGAPRDKVLELGELAWGEGALLESRDRASLGTPLLVMGLVIADDLERALEISAAALDAQGNEKISAADELTAYARARALYEQGRVGEAEAVAHAAVGPAPSGRHRYSEGILAVLARCHIERGLLEQAEAVLAGISGNGTRDSVGRASVLDARAQLRLAQHRPQDALQDALDAGSLLAEQLPHASPGSIAWRSSAALAHLALGEAGRASALIEEELEHARRIGVTRIVVRDLRILGLALGGKRGLERLAEAVAVGGSYPTRLEYIRAVIDYGGALRRANQRADAREPLRLGLDLSHRGGSSVLESRARAELVAAGARPRRAVLSGVDSLTPSQRRVAELAGSGMTTRQVAAALFVTPKTIEFHLRNVYAKLDVGSREELAKRLSEALPTTA